MTKKRVLLRCLLLLLCSLGTTECKSVGARESRRAGAKASSPRRLVDSLEPSGHACGFFVWDFVSAILYDWCKTLSKNWEYEGRGGKKVCVCVCVCVCLFSQRTTRPWFVFLVALALSSPPIVVFVVRRCSKRINPANDIPLHAIQSIQMHALWWKLS